MTINLSTDMESEVKAGDAVTLTLAATRGNQMRAAEVLGLNRNTLRKRLHDLGIEKARARVASRMTNELVLGTTTATTTKASATNRILRVWPFTFIHSRPNRPVGLMARISAIGA